MLCTWSEAVGGSPLLKRMHTLISSPSSDPWFAALSLYLPQTTRASLRSATSRLPLVICARGGGSSSHISSHALPFQATSIDPGVCVAIRVKRHELLGPIIHGSLNRLHQDTRCLSTIHAVLHFPSPALLLRCDPLAYSHGCLCIRSYFPAQLSRTPFSSSSCLLLVTSRFSTLAAGAPLGEMVHQ